MKPKEFVEDNEYQEAPVRDTAKDIRIFASPTEEWIILSYYYSPEMKRMILDIARKQNN